MERTDTAFGNEVDRGSLLAAEKAAAKWARRFGDDRKASYPLAELACPEAVAGLGLRVLGHAAEGCEPLRIDPGKSVALGTIRMGYGHYRIALALASAARSRGLEPYWFDLMGFPKTTGAKIVARLNDLYSFGSRLSQKSRLFNRFYWEPLNSEGFRRLSYYVKDRRTAELMTPVFGGLPKDLPFVAAHAWPAQAAVAAGMERVVDAIPDNWPMALHLAEGAVHAVQSPSAYLGYRSLRGMAGPGAAALRPMPRQSVRMVGHYVDHEIASNIGVDCALRRSRAAAGSPRRFLLSVGGAGAQREALARACRRLLPEVEAGRATLWINFGDHAGFRAELFRAVPGLEAASVSYRDDWPGTAAFAARALDPAAPEAETGGVRCFLSSDVFSAVYCTNLLMRACDVLVTKPSELAFYPVPKLLLKRVGGHEAWGAIRSAELGDGTVECATEAEEASAFDLFMADGDLLDLMCGCIEKNAAAGVYGGAYAVVDLARSL